MGEDPATERSSGAGQEGVGETGPNSQVIVELGAGKRKAVAAAWGVDRVRLPGVDLVADLRTVLPIKDLTVDRLIAFSVVEHVPDIGRLMRECWRVLRPGGEVWIKAPDPESPTSWEDPTHVRPYPRAAFLYFVRGHEKNYYFDIAFSSFRDELDVVARQAFWRWRWLSRLVTTLRIPLLRRAYQPIYVLVK